MKKYLNLFVWVIGPLTIFGLNFDGQNSTGLILIGDTGKDNQGQLNVSRSIGDLCQRENCSLGILAGDVVYPEGISSEDDPILETMFDKYYDYLNFPFLIALGNHDYGKFSRDWSRGRYQLKHATKNPSFHLPHYFYTYETEESIFAVIDTTRLMWEKNYDVQAKMVKEAYERSKLVNKWFMVVGHHPYLSNGKHGNAGNYERLSFPSFVSGEYVKRFIDRFVCGKAHFYLSGHEHSLQVFDGNIAKCNTHLVVSGSGASSSKLFERNKSEFEISTPGYFYLNISKDVVILKAINSTSEILFEKSYSRE